MAVKAYASKHTYSGKSEINFYNDGGGLVVNIDTERTHMRSIRATEEDCQLIVNLVADKKVMEKNGNGKPLKKEDVVHTVRNVWDQLWKSQNPYSALVVFRKDTGNFIGVISLMDMKLGYVFHQKHWRQGYGKETVTAIVQDYIPFAIHESNLQISRLTATAWPNNPASIRILEKAGFHFVRMVHEDNRNKRQYTINLDPKSEDIPTFV